MKGVGTGLLVVLVILALGGLATDNTNLPDYFSDINNALVVLATFFVAVGLLGFIYNIIRYFIIESGNEEGRANAKRYALWSIMGFVFVVSIWGLVNLLVTSSDIGRELIVCPDYSSLEYCRSIQ